MYKIYFFSAFVLFSFVVDAQDFRFGEVSLEEVEEALHPLDEETDAAVLYRNQDVYYEYSNSTGFTLVTDVHERIKIYTKEGFDWATKKFPITRTPEIRRRFTPSKVILLICRMGNL